MFFLFNSSISLGRESFADNMVRAVHINGMTVHDEPCLPHGGWNKSGFGRFAGVHGYDEFLQTKSVTWVE